MARRKQTTNADQPSADVTDQVPEAPTADPQEFDMPAKSKIVFLDYNGNAANQPQQRPVPHSFSPRVINMFEDGVSELVLHPGAAPIDRELFERYSKDQADVKSMVKRGELTELDTLPRYRDLISGDYEQGTGGLICRTRTQAGLDFIEEKAREQYDGGELQDILEMIGHRRVYANAIKLQGIPFIEAIYGTPPSEARG